MWSEDQWEASKAITWKGDIRQTDIATLWPSRPRGPSWWKLCYYYTQKWLKMGKNRIIQLFLKIITLNESRSPPQELEVGQQSEPYLLVILTILFALKLWLFACMPGIFFSKGHFVWQSCRLLWPQHKRIPTADPTSVAHQLWSLKHPDLSIPVWLQVLR